MISTNVRMWLNTGSRRKQMQVGGVRKGEHVSERHPKLLAGLASGTKNNGPRERIPIK